MAGPQPVVTVANQDLVYLDQRDVVNLNYDANHAFERAIKVFLVSYPEFNNQSLQIYQQMFNQYFDEMSNLYEVQVNDMQFMDQLRREIASETYEFSVGVIRFKGRQEFGPNGTLQNIIPRIVVNTSVSQSNPIDLDISNEIQVNTRHRRSLSVNDLIQLRAENRTIGIDLMAKRIQSLRNQLPGNTLRGI